MRRRAVRVSGPRAPCMHACMDARVAGCAHQHSTQAVGWGRGLLRRPLPMQARAHHSLARHRLQENAQRCWRFKNGGGPLLLILAHCSEALLWPCPPSPLPSLRHPLSIPGPVPAFLHPKAMRVEAHARSLCYIVPRMHTVTVDRGHLICLLWRRLRCQAAREEPPCPCSA